jgi:hypothetical protein
VGAGVEYALTPGWSLMLEYDYLGFGTSNVATPYVAGNPLLGPLGSQLKLIAANPVRNQKLRCSTFVSSHR